MIVLPFRRALRISGSPGNEQVKDLVCGQFGPSDCQRGVIGGCALVARVAAKHDHILQIVIAELHLLRCA